MEKQTLDQKSEPHVCERKGWHTNCELEPPCVWLEDTEARGFQWGTE